MHNRQRSAILQNRCGLYEKKRLSCKVSTTILGRTILHVHVSLRGECDYRALDVIEWLTMANVHVEHQFCVLGRRWQG